MPSIDPGNPRNRSISLPHLRFRHALAGLACFAAAGVAQAQTTTGTAGGGAPFGNQQPTLTVTQAIMTTGIFPSSGSGSTTFGATLGFIYPFAGAFAPEGSIDASGQSLVLSGNVALFSLLGTTYGGDGSTTFNVPDLGDRAAMGTGTGPGLTARTLGGAVGSATVLLTTAQMPAHAHSVFGGGFTGVTGGSQPFDNVQPSLPLQRLIATNGVFPQPPGNGVGSAAFLGQVATFAGNFVPSGWTLADGRLLTISTNTALFAVLGTTYGGDGITTFALPDLRGRIVVGAEPAHPVGSVFGEESVTLSTAEMAIHNHAIPGGSMTGIAGSGQPFDNQQPSLALNYIIATQGLYPSPGGLGFDTDTPILGQIAEFAGNYAPSGWALCDGSLLGIATNSALFNVIGTRYGGDGITNFALPDLRGRTIAGASTLRSPGTIAGTAATTLSVGNLPVHSHTVTVTVPTISSATYDASTGSLTVTGTDLLANAGGPDIAAAQFMLTGEGGSTYTLTDTADVEISSATAFTLTLSATDRAALGPILNRNGTSSSGGTTYNLSAFENWDTGADPATVIADILGNGITVSNVAVPRIGGSTYNAATGKLVVSGSGFLSLAGALNDIVANRFTLTGEGGATYTLTDTANVDIASGTSFTLTLSVTDRLALAQILNKNGASSTGGTSYNLAANEDWAAGADPAVVVADTTGNGITVSNVAVPAISFGTYDAATGALTVTGSGFLSLAGAANDIVANRLTITGEGGATYTLTNTANVDIDSGSSFTMFLSATDRAGVDGLLNKNGTSSTGGTTYNLAAAEDWNAGADPATAIADTTGNGIIVLNVAVPAITSATYDATTGMLSVAGTGFLTAAGATNDVVASKLTITGKGGATYTLTDTADVDITSGTAFTLTLSATDKAAAAAILDANGTSASDATPYNLAAAEDWAAGADPAVVVADTTGNGITVSGVTPPVVMFTVTPSAGPNGTIAPAAPQSVVAGTTTSFIVTPSAGYTASVGGSCGGSLAGTTYTTNAINASCTVVATFTAIPVTTFSGASATGSGTITASFTGGGAGCGFASAAFIPLTGDPRSPPAGTAPANLSFPHGLFDFTLSGCTAGSTVAFTIVYPQPLPAGTGYWKYGPTPSDPSPHWYRLPATVSGDTVTFSITDGAIGDDDLSANGTVVDQGGPGAPGGGAPVAVPTLSEWMLLALAALLALGGLHGLRRKA
jgi:microcystin-dependent protein